MRRFDLLPMAASGWPGFWCRSRSKCGRGLAPDGGLWADQDAGSDRVHIRCCGHGCYGFRPYGGSLLKSAKVSKTLLPHHSAPRLGSVCPNAGLNNPASCRVTHGFKPAFGQRGLTGRLRSRSKADQDQERLASHRGYPIDRSHAPRGNASRDALRHLYALSCRRNAERPRRHSHAERGNDHLGGDQLPAALPWLLSSLMS